MPCPHISTLRTPDGVRRVSLAAENLFCASARPCRGTRAIAVLRCVEPHCNCPTSGDVHVCVQCVHTACRAASHLTRHGQQRAHHISLSVEHGRLYCVVCDDFVYEPYLDAAVELQRRIAESYRRNFLSSASPLNAGSHAVRANGTTSASSHALIRARTKRRRVVAVDHWAPTEAELALIDAHSVGRLAPVSAPAPPVGLYNLGNSCYMNAVLQAFLNAPPLRCYFLGDSHRPTCSRARKKIDCLACAFDTLVCDSHAGELAPDAQRDARAASPPASPPPGSPFLVPQRVLEIMWKHAEHLASYAQHDAHEFLIATLNVLNSHCRLESRSPAPAPEMIVHDPALGLSASAAPAFPVVGAAAAAGRTVAGAVGAEVAGMPMDLGTSPRGGPMSPVANLRGGTSGDFKSTKNSPADGAARMACEQSIVHNLFSGTLQSDVICRVCGNTSPTLEKFYDISLDVDNVVKPSVRRSRASSPDAANVASGRATPSGGATPAGGSSRAASVDGGPGSADGAASGSGGAASGGAALGMPPIDASDGYGTSGSSPVVMDGSGVEQHSEMETANSLAECLARFTEPEMLGEAAKMYCQQCGVRQEAMKQMSIRSLPPVLCFHFKRFEQSFAKIRRSEMVKIDTAVEFPVDNLDMSAFQTSAVARKRTNDVETAAVATGLDRMEAAGPDADADADGDGSATTAGAASIAGCDGGAVYDLFAVVNHTGKIDRGHYTTLVRRRGAWFKCDDDKVTTAPRVGSAIRSGEAYLVFYTQRKPNLTY